jgi:hypothetical protein
MSSYIRRLVLRHLVSPYGIALIPYAFFLFAWSFPPNVYSYYIREPDLMYHNPMVLLFFTLCVAAFLLGVRIAPQIRSTAADRMSLPRIRLRFGSPVIYILVPLLIAAIPCLIFVGLIAADNNFLALILSQRGEAIKAVNSTGSLGGGDFWGSTLFLLTGVLWWAAFRASQLQLSGGARRLFNAVFAASFVIDVLACLGTFDRTNLMPLLAGLIIIFLFFKTRAADVKLSRLVIIALASVFGILAVFIVLQLARSAAHVDALITSMLGYTIVSYNRLAALVMGIMHYVYQGKGGYVVVFLTQNPRFTELRDRMGLPNFFVLWLSEFGPLAASGLNSSFNYSSVFGYLFSDLGWWTPVYMAITGIFAGSLWSRFRAGTTLGLVLYPWMVFWILFWFGWNLLFDARGVVLLETSVLLFLYDKLCLLRRSREAARPVIVSQSSWEPAQPAITSHRGGFL